MSDSTVSDFPAKSFVYIYYMLKKITSSFLRYASYLTEAPQYCLYMKTTFNFFLDFREGLHNYGKYILSK